MMNKRYAPDDKICWKCVSDQGLQKLVRKSGKREKCAGCESKLVCLSIEEIAHIVDPVVRKFFSVKADEFYTLEDTECYFENQEQGEPLSSILSEIIGSDYYLDTLQNSLIEMNIESYGREHHFYDDDARYEANYGYGFGGDAKITNEWHNVNEKIKLHGRYFGNDARALFDSIFSDLRSLQTFDKEQNISVIRKMRQGQSIWRGRRCASYDDLQLFLTSPKDHLAPPPLGLAKAGRMNAEGISVFYGALEEDTCVAEIRPSIGDLTIVGLFKTNQDLSILDFSLLERAIFSKKLSYFDDQFLKNREKQNFLHQLHKLISAPVVPGQERNYLITQILSEYLSHICQPKINGLQFKSTQRDGGINIVLFLNQSEYIRDVKTEIPVTYSGISPNIFETTKVVYRNRQVRPDPHRQGDVIPIPDWELDQEGQR